jgi:hypothetical protein
MTSTNINARTAWAALSPDEQYSALRRVAATVPRRCDRHGWHNAEWMGQTETWEDSLDLIAGEGWTHMEHALDKAGDKPLTFALVIAAMTATRKLNEFYRPHARSRAGSPESLPVEDMGRLVRSYAGSPEDLAAAQDAADRMCQDEMDRRIVAHALRGDNQEEIAQVVGVDQGTVSRRLRKMRARYDG